MQDNQKAGRAFVTARPHLGAASTRASGLPEHKLCDDHRVLSRAILGARKKLPTLTQKKAEETVSIVFSSCREKEPAKVLTCSKNISPVATPGRQRELRESLKCLRPRDVMSMEWWLWPEKRQMTSQEKNN